MKHITRSAALAAILLTLSGLILINPSVQAQADIRQTLADPLPLDARQSIRAQIHQARYHFAPVADGYAASNRGMQARFTSDGEVRVRQPNAPPLSLRLTAYGYGDDLQTVPPAQAPLAAQNRLAYRRGAITEWYFNDERGLEQGFTLEKRPAPLATEALHLLLSLDTPLTPHLRPDAQGVVFKNRAHQTVFTYDKLHVFDAEKKTVPAHFTLAGTQALRIVVDDRQAVYPLVVDPLITNVQRKFNRVHVDGDDHFGTAVALAGDTLLIGAPGDESCPLSPCLIQGGAAYVFVRHGGQWQLQTKLLADDAETGDDFGVSVALSGDGRIALIGADWEREEISWDYLGAAYVFIYNPYTGLWEQQQKLQAADGWNGDQFGHAVALSSDGRTALIGAYRDDDQDHDSGSAYVFGYDDSSGLWRQQVKLLAEGGTADDEFGYSVDLNSDGQSVLIGAPGDTDKGIGGGAAYVFSYDSSSDVWTQQKFLAADGAESDFFGESVALSSDGKTALIGAKEEDEQGNEAGAAYVLRYDDISGIWSQRKLLAADGAAYDGFGRAVALDSDGDRALIGSFWNSDNGTHAGAAYVFSYDSGTDSWSQQKLLADDGTAEDEFGSAAALSSDGQSVVIGAQVDDDRGSKAGSAYVFNHDNGAWSQQKLTDDVAAGDRFGISVSVSGDGLTALVGASRDDDAGYDDGAAYVFSVGSSGLWLQQKLLPGSGGNDFGQSTALSSDGRIALIKNTQATYIFIRDNNSGLWTEHQKLSVSGRVALSGDGRVVLIGGNESAEVFVYDDSSGLWTQQQPLAVGSVSDNFGISVAVSDDGMTALIGASMDNENGSGSGAAYVFSYDSSSDVWIPQQKLLAADGAGNDFLGEAVALSGDGNTALVGAKGQDDKGSFAGAAYVFTYDSSSDAWTQQDKFLAADGATTDQFGGSVALNHYGTAALIGARQDDSGAGAAYLFIRHNGAWQQQQKFTATDRAENDWFGYAVAVNGATALVGAYRDDDGGEDSGSVYLFPIPFVNHAPLYNTNGFPILDAIDEDPPCAPTVPCSAIPGTSVAVLIASASGDPVTDTADEPYTDEGIAVTGFSGGDKGNWEYSLDDGAAWLTLDAVSDNHALLLGDADRLRFVPTVPEFNTAGNPLPALHFRAWDRSNACAGPPFAPIPLSACVRRGDYGDVSVNGDQIVYLTGWPGIAGGQSAYSAAEETATLTVNPVSDPLVLEPLGNQILIQGQPQAFAVTVSDPLDDPPNTLGYNLVPALPWLSIDSATGIITAAPSESTVPGEYPVTLVVTETDGTPAQRDDVSEDLTLWVLPAIAPQPVPVDLPFSVDISGGGSYPDLRFALQGGPAGAEIHPTSGMLTWTPTSVGDYTLTVNISEAGGQAVASQTVAVTAAERTAQQAYTGMSLDTSSPALLYDDNDLAVFGKLSRYPSLANTDLSGHTIRLEITPPDGQTVTLEKTTHTDTGQYAFSGADAGFPTLDQEGAYTFQTFFAGSGSLVAAASVPQTVMVGASAGYVVLVQGKVSNEEGLESHNKTLRRFYETLLARGFAAENIAYFSYSQNAGIATLPPGKAAIGNTLSELAVRMNASPAPLYLIMVDHGGPQGFYLENELITPEEVAGWLDTLEAGLNAAALAKPRFLLVGACYSGAFMRAAAPPTDTDAGRVVITSSAADEVSYKGPMEPDGIRSGELFMDELRHALEDGESFGAAFNRAVATVERLTRQGGTVNTVNPYNDEALQHPLLDDNGDRIGSNFLSINGDGRRVADLYLGALLPSDSNPYDEQARIPEVPPVIFLAADENSAHLNIVVNNADRVDPASIDIRLPSTTLEKVLAQRTEQQVVDRLTRVDTMDCTAATIPHRCSKDVTIFSEPGRYELFYFVRDNETHNISALKRAVVYKRKPAGENTAPFTVQLLSPANNAKTETVLLLDWTTSADPDGDAVTYTLLVATDSTMQNVVHRQEGLEVSMTTIDDHSLVWNEDEQRYTRGLQDQTLYYWRVDVVDAFGAITSSGVFRFTTDNTSTPGCLLHVLSNRELDFNSEVVFSCDISDIRSEGNIAIAEFVECAPCSVDIAGFTKEIIPTVGAAADIPITLQPQNVSVDNFSLTINRPSLGTIMVSSSPQNMLLCGTQGSGCNAEYPQGTRLEISAQPDSGAEFVRWRNSECGSSSNVCRLWPDSDVTITAEFVQLPPPDPPVMPIPVTPSPPVVIQTPVPGTIRFASGFDSRTESSGEVQIALVREQGDDGVLAVDYRCDDHTARANSDYQCTPGSLQWNDGESGAKYITVFLVNDTEVEEIESLLITFSSSDDSGQAVLEIQDDDEEPEPAGQVQFLHPLYNLAENAGDVSVGVARVNGNTGAISVAYQIQADTAQAGVDYQAITTGTLNWADGDSSEKSIPISLEDDSEDENTESLLMRLQDPQGAGLGIRTETVLNIIDNDEPPEPEITSPLPIPVVPGTVRLSSASYSSREDSGETRIEFIREGGDDGVIELNYHCEAHTASTDSDYQCGSGTLQWNDGESGPRHFGISLVDDEEVESTESLVIVFSSPGYSGQTVLEIIDDDDPCPDNGSCVDGSSGNPPPVTGGPGGQPNASIQVSQTLYTAPEANHTIVDVGGITTIQGQLTRSSGDLYHYPLKLTVTTPGGALQDYNIRTDETGHYAVEFFEFFETGIYTFQTFTDTGAVNSETMTVSARIPAIQDRLVPAFSVDTQMLHVPVLRLKGFPGWYAANLRFDGEAFVLLDTETIAPPQEPFCMVTYLPETQEALLPLVKVTGLPPVYRAKLKVAATRDRLRLDLTDYWRVSP